MAEVVRLHVGAPKTGTSHLQGRLLVNRTSLAEQGIAYPVGPAKSMFGPALDLIDRPWGGRRELVHGEWAALAKRVRAAPGTVLLSHEILASATREQATRAIADLDAEIHLIYSARDIARQVPSSWQQSLKHQGSQSFDRYLAGVMTAERRNSRLFFWQVQGMPDVLDRWGANLPPDQIHVVTVPPTGSHPDELWRRYCQAFELDPAWLPEQAVGRSNVSLGIDEAALLRELNRRLSKAGLESDAYRVWVQHIVAKQTLARRENVRPVTLPPNAYGWAEDVAEEWIAFVKSSGVHVVGELDDVRPVVPDGGEWEDPDKPRPRLTADAAMDALVAVILQGAARPDALPRRVKRRLRSAAVRLRRW